MDDKLVLMGLTETVKKEKENNRHKMPLRERF